MKTGKHLSTQHSGDKDRIFYIEFEECLIECRVLFTSYYDRGNTDGYGEGETMDYEVMSMDIFDHVGNRVPLSEINEEEVYEIIEPHIKY